MQQGGHQGRALKKALGHFPSPGAISSPLFRNVESVGREMGLVGQNCSLQRLVSLPNPPSPPVVGRSLDKVNLLSRRKFQKPTLKRNSSFRPLQEGNPCSMTEVMRRVSLSKPPVDMGMYRTLYMMDYQPYTDNHQWPHAEERLILDAQLKAKEFARPIKQEAVKYAEEPVCQEVQPPSPTMMMSRVGRGSSAPQPYQATEKSPQKDFPAVLPSPQPSPPTKSVAANQAEEVERMSPSMQPRAVPACSRNPLLLTIGILLLLLPSLSLWIKILIMKSNRFWTQDGIGANCSI